jgi:hypothetical protein
MLLAVLTEVAVGLSSAAAEAGIGGRRDVI